MMLDKVIKAYFERQKEWDPYNKFDLMYAAVELSGEVGEALNIIKKMKREELGRPGSRASAYDLGKELADIIICTCGVACRTGIDLEKEVIFKFNETSEKYGFYTKI